MRCLSLLAVAICAVTAAANDAYAQLPQTRLYAVSPAGAKVGTSTDVTITNGADLDEVDRLIFGHPGITAVQKTVDQNGKPQPVPNTFTVSVAADVPPGLYEVFCSGYYGLSNPRTFVVGKNDELTETEPNNAVEQATEAPLDKVINAVVGSATDVDYFKFRGEPGQRVLVTCQAARIDSRLNATIELYDAAGRRVDYSRNVVRDDPLIDYTIESSGDYFLRVFDFTYRGGPDYFYRLSVSTAPHIDFIVPPAGIAGTTSKYTLYGRNLPGGQPTDIVIDGDAIAKLDVDITLPADPATLNVVDFLSPIEMDLDGISYRLETEQGSSNPVMICFASAPVAVEQEPNDEPGQAQKLTLPAELSGAFQKTGDTDYVSFEAKAGEIYYIEMFGERTNRAPTDPYFVLDQIVVNDKGEQSTKRISALDDNATNLAPIAFDTISDDPAMRFQVPADGTYRLQLRDRYFETRGDARLVYRLAIRKESPEFRLAIVTEQPQAPGTQAAAPWAVGLRKGDHFDVRVVTSRRDGFSGAIEVSADGLPEGVVCPPVVIGAGQTTANLVFTATENAPNWAGMIRVLGKAKIDDPAQVRAVEAARGNLKAPSDSLAKLVEATKNAAAAVAEVDQKLTAALTAARANPNDEAQQKSLIEAVKTAAASDGVLKQAQEAQAGGEKTLADVQATVAAAETARAAAVRDVTHEARAATIVWNGDQTTPAISRVGRTLGLSVHSEQAPFEVKTDVARVTANQGRQILVPVALAKRNSFDEAVNLAFAGLANSKIQPTNKPVAKGAASELLKLFVPNDAPPGIYTLYLTSQGQVSYRRNLPRLERIKAENAEITKQSEAAAIALKTATEQRDAATKQAAVDAEAVKTAQSTQTEMEKKAVEAVEVAKKATESKTKADEIAATVQKAVDAATQAANEAKIASEKSADDKTLAEALSAAAKLASDAVAKVTEGATKAKETQAAALKALEVAETASKTAQEQFAAAQKTLTAAQEAATKSQTAQQETDAAQKKADEAAKAATASKTQSDQKLQETEKASQPQNINVFSPSTPIIIEVKPSPMNLAAAVPNNGALKQGEKVDVKVTVTRINGFSGPLTLSLPLPPGVAGLTAEAVTVPADKNEGVVSIAAAADATEGQLQNLVVRATSEFNGEAAVDVPVALTVSK